MLCAAREVRQQHALCRTTWCVTSALGDDWSLFVAVLNTTMVKMTVVLVLLCTEWCETALHRATGPCNWEHLKLLGSPESAGQCSHLDSIRAHLHGCHHENSTRCCGPLLITSPYLSTSLIASSRTKRSNLQVQRAAGNFKSRSTSPCSRAQLAPPPLEQPVACPNRTRLVTGGNQEAMNSCDLELVGGCRWQCRGIHV